MTVGFSQTTGKALLLFEAIRLSTLPHLEGCQPLVDN